MSEAMKPMITVEDTGKEFKVNVELEGMGLENEALEKSLEDKAKDLMDYAEKMIMIKPPKKWHRLSIDRDAVKAKLEEVATATEQLIKEKKGEILESARSMNVEVATVEFGPQLRKKIEETLNGNIGEVVAAAEERTQAPQHNIFSTNAKRADDMLRNQ